MFAWIYEFQGEHWMTAPVPQKTQYLSQDNKWDKDDASEDVIAL
jgi:hypothetical protein